MTNNFVAWLKATGKAKATAVKAEIAEILHDAIAADKLVKDFGEYEDAREIVTRAFTRELRKP